MEYALELTQINKRYQNRDVLRNLNMQVPAGKVYGFLGRNGAGKTTTIRIITGLVKANAGQVRVFDRELAQARAEIMQNIGAIVESPAFYPNLTGKENLGITAALFGTDDNRIPAVLRLVDMEKDQNRKVKTYSTGMKQRLAIANALLHAPKLLILDEPTNGLDPNGVKDLRSLIRRLSKDLHITLLVSSHILSEVQQIADCVGILDQGQIVDQFDLQELNQREQSGLLLEVETPDQAVALLRKADILFSQSVDRQIKVLCPRAENAKVGAMLTSGGIQIVSMKPVMDTLEDRFFSATGGDQSEWEA